VNTNLTFLDCTLRDGGYYNSWDFPLPLVNDYLLAMQQSGVNTVELGFRFLKNEEFMGPSAFTTDEYLRSLTVPDGLEIAVMVNGSDLVSDGDQASILERLFPCRSPESPVRLVRLACHVHELQRVFPAARWLRDRGFRVGFNLMQIADRSKEEVSQLARAACDWPIDALYFADSMGGMRPSDVGQIVGWIRSAWQGPIGIHTHDNMGLALQNTLEAIRHGATWVDSTVTGMGRGPGNARTEELAIEVAAIRGLHPNLVPLMGLIRKHFQPLKARFGWGSNPFYYLSGMHGIHPTFVQEMLSDARFEEADVLAVIDRLRGTAGKKYSTSALESALIFYDRPVEGAWRAGELMAGREVLLLGAGPGVVAHRTALESYVRRCRPLTIAMNLQAAISPELIDLRVACHPLRLIADAPAHRQSPHPLVAPAGSLPVAVREALGERVLDFGLRVQPGHFCFGERSCTAPTSQVISYALALIASGGAARLMMAGFDGYAPGDPRNLELARIVKLFRTAAPGLDIRCVTPSFLDLPHVSIYGM
jgi:4-hydroxy 2-oxovalerate aldolase